MSSPGISLLMPAFNGGDMVLDAVAGALDQMGPADEMLVQDGGSTDGSVQRLRDRFADRPQLKIVSAPDGGQADALNKALARAQNPVIGWLNADDRIYPGALDAVRSAWARAGDPDVVYGNWRIFDNDERILRDCVSKEFTLTSLTLQPHVFSGTVFMNRDLVRETGGFDVDMYMCMDLDLLLRLASRRPEYVRIPEVLAGFRWHDASKTGVMDFRVVREAFVCRRRYATGVRSTLVADFSSLLHLLAWLASPLRQAKWYGRFRVAVQTRRKQRAQSRSEPERHGLGA